MLGWGLEEGPSGFKVLLILSRKFCDGGDSVNTKSASSYAHCGRRDIHKRSRMSSATYLGFQMAWLVCVPDCRTCIVKIVNNIGYPRKIRLLNSSTSRILTK